MKDELIDGRGWGTSPFLYSTVRTLIRTGPPLSSDLAMCCIWLGGRDFAIGLVQTEPKKLYCSKLTSIYSRSVVAHWLAFGHFRILDMADSLT